MLKTHKAAAALATALVALLFAIGVAGAADDGPIVHDYSHTGASDYKAPENKSASQRSANSGASDRSSGNANGKPYKVNCKGKGPCEVGSEVMAGYETFGGHCARCHGENGEGSTFAPSLVDKLKGMGQGQFTAAVAGGMTKKDTTTGTYKVMPAWGSNPQVMNHVTQIWAYLKARSDGALKPGRPKAMGKGQDSKG